VTPGSRIGLILAAIAVLIGGFLLANSSGGDSKNGSSAQTITVSGGKPAGGIQDITVAKGDTIAFKVVSDVSDEIHVHGYDLMKDVKAGGSIAFAFPATIDGKFEIELEGAKQQIASLTVTP
jgi:hypothetical protein